MNETREQKRARLMAAAEAAIDELLAWEETNQAPNLTQIETEVLKLREGFGQEMALAVLEGQAARQPADEVKCPACGQAMRYKGQKPTGIESWVVNSTLKRGYYYCPACKQGFFPPGPTT
jgi:hypothetical protein